MGRRDRRLDPSIRHDFVSHEFVTMIQSGVESESRIITLILLVSLVATSLSSASPRISSSFRSPFTYQRFRHHASSKGTFSQPSPNLHVKRWNERFQSTVQPPMTTLTIPSMTKVRQSESKNVTLELAVLQSQLEARRQLLSVAKERHRMLSKKLERMIKKARRKRLRFYDTMFLKTMKFNRASYQRIKNQISYLDSTSVLLTEPANKTKPSVKLRDWQAEVILRKASKEHLIDDSDQILADSSLRVEKLNVVLDDIARQKNLL